MINGTVDQVSGLLVRGWATDPERPDGTAELDIYVDGALLGCVPADLYRPDLHAAGIGHGSHGFAYELPRACADGAVHRLAVQWRGTNLRLSGVDQFVCDAAPAFAAEAVAADLRPYVLDRPLADALAALGPHRRVAVVATFSTRPELWAYQVELLRSLGSAGFAIVHVHSHMGHVESIFAQTRGLTALSIVRQNRGFDFGSFGCALDLIAPLRDGLDQLVLANDSVFGPVQPIENALRSMKGSPADFWGITDSWDVAYHLQSYFLVFRATALRHPAFAEFWRDYPAPDAKRRVIIDGEVGLTQALLRGGLQPAVLCPYEAVARKWLATARADASGVAAPGRRETRSWADPTRRPSGALADMASSTEITAAGGMSLSHRESAVAALAAGVPVNPTHLFWETLLLHFGSPFVKRDLVLKNPTGVPGLDRLPDALSRVGGYPNELIEEVRRLTTFPIAPPISSWQAPDDQPQRDSASAA